MRSANFRHYYPRDTGPNGEAKVTVHGCTCRGVAMNPHEFGDSDCAYHNAADAQPWNHSIPWNCPNYWDGCNCRELLETKTWEELIDEHDARVKKNKIRWIKSSH